MGLQFPGLLTPYCNYSYNNPVNPTDVIPVPMVAIGVVSDTFAIFGAIFIIFTYFAFKDLKTRARQFLVWIAFADLFNAIFYLIAQIYYLVDNRYAVCYANKSTAEIWICVGQAYGTNLFSLLSFSFTIILAVHILFLFFGKNIFKNRPMFCLSIVLGIGGPFVITTLAFVFGWLGPGGSVTIGWCFIRDMSQHKYSKSIKYSAIYEFLVGKIWDILTFVLISFIYVVIISRCVWKRHDRPIWKYISESDIKLFIIPIAFVFLRIWGEIHLLASIISTTSSSPYFLYPQAVFEPAQGWLNAVIYIIWTKNIRKRIYRLFFCKKNKEYLSINNEYSSDN